MVIAATGNYPQGLRRGKSILAREEDVAESGLALFKRGNTLRRKQTSSSTQAPIPDSSEPKNRSCLGNYAPGPKGPWMLYCYLLTVLVPPFMLRACGKYCVALFSPFSSCLFRDAYS